MATYGQEWQISEDPVPENILRITEELILQRYPGSTILSTMTIAYSEPSHDWMKCRSKKPHSHIYVKWVDETA